MGCTPSKLAAAYGEDTVCQDLDTCSTFVSSLKSSVSTPEGTRLRVDDTGGNPTSLSGEFNARPKIAVVFPPAFTQPDLSQWYFRL